METSETLQWGSAVAVKQPTPAPTVRVAWDRAREVVGTLPLPVDLILYQGDDFLMTLEVTNPDGTAADLTGVEASSQIRVTTSNPDIAAAFEASVATNIITLHLPNSESSRLPPASVWDCQITDTTGWITTLVAGNVATTAQVTR